MRISDWSSDVCSSDLLGVARRRSQDRPVLGVGGEEVGVGAVGDHPTVADQHDPIREGDGGGAVGDDDRGATAHHLAEGVTDLVLLGWVDRGGGVVEDQHPGIARKSTRLNSSQEWANCMSLSACSKKRPN